MTQMDIEFSAFIASHPYAVYLGQYILQRFATVNDAFEYVTTMKSKYGNAVEFTVVGPDGKIIDQPSPWMTHADEYYQFSPE